MMDNILYLEVRDANRLVRGIEAVDSVRAEAGKKLLIDAVEKIMELCTIARQEGLLALEEITFEMDKSNGYNYLEQLILLVVDGTEPEIIKESGTLMYFADDLSGYEALQFITFLWGMLAIQAGTNPRIIEQQLLTIMTKDIRDVYKKRQEDAEKAKEEAYKSGNETVDMSLVEKYSKGESPIKIGNDAYFITRLLDYLIINGLEDRAMQRVLRDIDNSDLTLVMKALSGEARSKIFKNLSRKLALMIAEDIEYMGRVELKHVVDAEHKMLNIITKLHSAGMILISDGELAEIFSKVISIPYEKQRQDNELCSAEEDLTRLINEYTSQRRILI